MPSKNERDAVLAAVAAVPPLLLRLALSYMRMKRRARAAESSFKRELILGGVPRREASELAAVYYSSVSVRQIIRGISGEGVPRFPGKTS
ncbi:MAG: hypothetical protein FJ151_04005 [Euryarchaeota archaeon]|nr:hypothetical protein [Euryarchaeota archaeon]